MKNIICIIARTNSQRLPEKVLRDVSGKKMIEHIIDSMKLVEQASEVYLCTSEDKNDEILLEIARNKNIKSYAGSRDSVIDRMLDVAELEEADNIIRVTGDNIFTDPALLNMAIARHEEFNAEYTRIENLPIGTTAEVMNLKAVKKCYSEINPNQSEYLAYFMFNPDKYKTLVLLPPPYMNLPYNTLTVDTQEDLERTKFITSNIGNMEFVTLYDIINLNIEKEIPHYKFDSNELIKLPKGKTITYSELREIYEARIKKSIQYNFKKEEYENSIRQLKRI